MSRSVPGAAVTLAAVLVAGVTLTAGVTARTALGSDGWRDDPRNTPFAAVWATGLRPLADRNGTIIATTIDTAGGPERQTTLPAAGLLIELLDLNLHDEVADDKELSLFGEAARPPLQVTVDADAQRAAASALGDRQGVITVIDPRNGDLLALAANLPDTTDGLPAWPAGSIIKPLVYATAFESGAIGPSASFPVETAHEGITNFGGTACGGTYPTVLAQSCNTAAVRTMAELDPQAFSDTASGVGFDTPSALLGVEGSRTPSTSALADPSTRAATAIGQGETRINPLTAAQIAATIAESGQLHPVRLLPSSTAAPSTVIAPDAATTVATGMRLAVTNGTAHRANLPNVTIAAKTGTAQSGLGYDHAWTIAYAPADTTPVVAVSVIILGQPSMNLTGGTDAAPAAGATIAAVVTQPAG